MQRPMYISAYLLLRYADPKTDILTSNCNEGFYGLVYPFLVNALGDAKH
jgi:hypothetical protein